MEIEITLEELTKIVEKKYQRELSESMIGIGEIFSEIDHVAINDAFVLAGVDECQKEAAYANLDEQLRSIFKFWSVASVCEGSFSD